MKFLADEGCPHNAVAMLKQLGWDVREITMDVPKLRNSDDVTKVLLYAKYAQRVLLSSDMFQDRYTRTELWNNVRRTRTGRAISVAGGPEKMPTQIVGKLLFHQEHWEKFLTDGHGLVQIGDLKPDTLRMRRPHQLYSVQHVNVQQGEDYLKRPRQLALPKPKPPAKPGASQALIGVS